MSRLWERTGIAASLASAGELVALHIVERGSDFNPIDHWLSEYVLSPNPVARLLMHLAFATLGLAVLSAAYMSPSRVVRAPLMLGAAALAAMTIFNTNRNDGRTYPMEWPPTSGNVHQFCLYVAIGAILAGVALRMRASGAAADRKFVAIGGTAAAIQTGLVAMHFGPGDMTRFGGLTERLMVLALLAWTAATCLRIRLGNRRLEHVWKRT